jgi:outer membrane protein TolC
MRTHRGIVTWIGAATLWALTAGAQTLTLEKALDIAFERNPDARLAKHRIAAARAGLEQANAAFWPRLQFQGSYIRTDNPMLTFGSILNQRAVPSGLDYNDLPDVDDFNARGLVTVPIYAGGRNRAGQEAARASTEAARFDGEAVRHSLAFEVVRVFHNVLKTREFIRAAEATVQSYQTNLGIATRRLEGGAVLKTDVLDIQVRLAQAQEDLVRAQNAHALVNRALRNLLGIEEGELTVADTAPTVRVPAAADISSRAELMAADQREKAAEQRVREARSGYLPRVSLFGSLDYDYGTKYDQGAGSYTAGGMLQWDLWDGRLTRGKVSEAQANFDSAQEERRKVRLALGLEAEQARLELRAATERLAVTERTVAQASESAELTRARFEQGTALANQLMDAEAVLVNARVRRAEAEADQRIAVGALRKALGMPQLDTLPSPEKK